MNNSSQSFISGFDMSGGKSETSLFDEFHRLVVWEMPGCVQCKATERHLEKRNIPFEGQIISDHPDKLEEFKENGFMSAPVTEVSKVLVDNDIVEEVDPFTGETVRGRKIISDEVVDVWGGYRPDELSAIPEKYGVDSLAIRRQVGEIALLVVNG